MSEMKFSAVHDPLVWEGDGALKVGDVFTEEWLDRFRGLMQAYNDAARWIPVSERLPEDGAFVLAFAPCIGREPINTARYFSDRGGRWITIFTDPVTHWMPLPAPPDESTA